MKIDWLSTGPSTHWNATTSGRYSCSHLSSKLERRQQHPFTKPQPVTELSRQPQGARLQLQVGQRLGWLGQLCWQLCWKSELSSVPRYFIEGFQRICVQRAKCCTESLGWSGLHIWATGRQWACRECCYDNASEDEWTGWTICLTRLLFLLTIMLSKIGPSCWRHAPQQQQIQSLKS